MRKSKNRLSAVAATLASSESFSQPHAIAVGECLAEYGYTVRDDLQAEVGLSVIVSLRQPVTTRQIAAEHVFILIDRGLTIPAISKWISKCASP